MPTIKRKFTDDMLSKLNAKEAGTIFTDTAYGAVGSGTLMVRVAKSGRVSATIKCSVDGKLVKGILEDPQGVLKSGGVHAYLDAGGSARSLRLLAAERVSELQERGVASLTKQDIASVGAAYLDRRQRLDPYGGRGARAVELVIERAAAVWKDTALDKLTKSDAEDLMDDIRRKHGPQAANQARGYLPSILSYAARSNKGVDTNLFKKLNLRAADYAPKPRKDVLTPSELARVFDAMKTFEAAGGVVRERSKRDGRPKERVEDKCDSLRLIYFTAARKGEWDQAVWGDVDLQTGTWMRPGENRKKGEEHEMWLAAPAIAILERVKARRIEEGRAHGPGDLVFSSLQEGTERHQEWLKLRSQRLAEERRVTREELVAIGGVFSDTTRHQAWVEIKEVAGIVAPVRVHDLRATRVSHWIFEDRLSEREVGAMIGSRDLGTLVRHYARDTAEVERKQERVNSSLDAGLAL